MKRILVIGSLKKKKQLPFGSLYGQPHPLQLLAKKK